jgi:hypothetical protein
VLSEKIGLIKPEKIEKEQELVYKVEDGSIVREEIHRVKTFYEDNAKTRE